MRREIAIIGAGAAGCFCGALLCGDTSVSDNITIYEAGHKPLAKVAITGGGRCNLTNSFRDTGPEKAYPRGGRLMKRLMHGFSQEDTCKWFRTKGVELVTQEDQCVFPKSQSAMQIVSTLLRELSGGGARIITDAAVQRIEPLADGFRLHFADSSVKRADVVAVTIGGLSSAKMASLFQGLDLEIVKPVPSLFTLKTDSPIRELSGTVVKEVGLKLQGTKINADGTLLITDWGFSGPALLKLSSYAARELSDSGYKGGLAINWVPSLDCQELEALLLSYVKAWPEKQLSSVHPEFLTSRLWNFILDKASIKENIKFAELGTKNLRRLCALLQSDVYDITGRARFKEEFVTCGGVSLGQINPATLESKKYKGLYFAGEVLDIDAITGGFNLQAAWTTGYTVACAIGRSSGTKQE